jgi:hypothetical protein
MAKKKYKMVFTDKNDKKVKTVQFGAKGYEDYTVHKDKDRRTRYLKRHSKDRTDPMSAG